MTAIISLLVFIAAVLLSSALLAWPAHQIISFWTDYPFHKLLGHLAQLLGLLGAMIYLSLNGLFNRAGCGYQINNQAFLQQVGTGLLLGNMILLVIEALLFLLGLHGVAPQLQLTLFNFIETIFFACLAGLLVGVVEETIFRGAIQGVLMKHLNAVLAVLLSSLTYAAMHFIKYPELPADVVPAWNSGLILLADSFKHGYFISNFDKFITLFLLGALLGIIRVIKGNIALCIGVHAGLVMMMKLSRKWTDYLPGSDLDFLVNVTDHQLGLLSSIVLLIATVMIVVIRKKPRRPGQDPDSHTAME